MELSHQQMLRMPSSDDPAQNRNEPSMTDQYQPIYTWRQAWPGEGYQDFTGYDGEQSFGRIQLDQTNHGKAGMWKWNATPLPWVREHIAPNSGWEETSREACRIREGVNSDALLDGDDRFDDCHIGGTSTGATGPIKKRPRYLYNFRLTRGMGEWRRSDNALERTTERRLRIISNPLGHVWNPHCAVLDPLPRLRSSGGTVGLLQISSGEDRCGS
ncbi:hypothetical protein FHS26_003079 [Rhizobium pisi]|uniref:Uncharacterized protein n=1 Tax=Rhizobium pisi TaxID=574561 RepID=A0A7W5FZZ2_9HYPH|nr:hypothetical protein [Rhizobium pisi]